MSLRAKSYLVAGATMAILILILYFAARVIVTDSYTRLEQQDTRAYVERALNALADDLASLERTTGDYAGWDDTYAFMQDRSPTYLNVNFPDAMFENNQLSLVLLVNPAGDLVFGKAFDLESGQAAPVPERFRAMAPDNVLVRRPDAQSVISGAVMLPGGPMLVASRSILTSAYQGPMRGSVIMGRAVSQSEIERLAGVTRLALDLYPLADETLAPDVQAVRGELSDAQPIVVRPTDETSVRGYTRVKDVDGQPAFILRVTRPREIFQQGRQTLAYLVAALLIAGVALGAMLILFLELLVLARLARLNGEVARIGVSGDPAMRVAPTGHDELATLARAINQTLDSLDRSQKLVRQREREAVTLLDSLPVYAFFKDAKGKFITANQNFCQAVHCTRESIAGQTDYSLYSKERADRYRADDRRVIELGETVETDDETIWRGELPMVAATRRVPLKDETGQVIGLIGLVFDVTERRRAAQELALARDQALEALHFKSQLLAHMSHDLRTPIGTILGYAEMLQSGVYGALEEKQLGSLTRIILSANQLTRLVSDLLDQARIEAGKLVLKTRPFSPAALVGAVKSAEGLLAQDKHLELRTSVAPDVPDTLVGDWERLQQILVNLADNAIKFTERGSVSLRVIRPDAAHYAFEIADTGPGIAPDDQAVIFDAFKQGASAATGSRKGVGLGLSIVKQLTTLMDGQVTLSSQVGHGSTFTVTLPLSVAEEKTR